MKLTGLGGNEIGLGRDGLVALGAGHASDGASHHQ
jgi:hypothetical protein